MIKYLRYPKPLLIALLLLGIFVSYQQYQAYQLAQSFRIEVFPVEKGWGYQILKGEKILIRQAAMPVKVGNQGFPSRASALRVGQWVCKRVQDHQNPSLNQYRLDSLIQASYP